MPSSAHGREHSVRVTEGDACRRRFLWRWRLERPGAIAAGCTPVLGIDSDAAPLKLWATNCSPAGRAVCATIGEEAVDWPEAAPDVHVTHTVHTNGVELPQRPTSTTRP